MIVIRALKTYLCKISDTTVFIVHKKNQLPSWCCLLRSVNLGRWTRLRRSCVATKQSGSLVSPAPSVCWLFGVSNIFHLTYFAKELIPLAPAGTKIQECPMFMFTVYWERLVFTRLDELYPMVLKFCNWCENTFPISWNSCLNAFFSLIPISY